MNLNPNQIEEIANIVREDLNLDTPVLIEEVPQMLGGSLKYVNAIDDRPGIEAMITKNNNTFEILIKKDGYKLRDRFSIAHELGHLFLHMGFILDDNLWDNSKNYTDSVYYRSGYNTEEYEANEFAGALLMPKEDFINKAKEHYYNGKYDLAPISVYFNVSIDAIKTRGRRLGLFSWEG